MPNFKPHLRTFLSCSTAHLTSGDLRHLTALCRTTSRRARSLPLVTPHPYGFWLLVPADPSDEALAPFRAAGFSPSLVRLIDNARLQEAEWIHFDHTAGLIHGLPRYRSAA